MDTLRSVLPAALALAVVPAPALAAGTPAHVPSGARAVSSRVAAPARFAPRRPTKVGLGATLTTSDGGEIFGFDVNQNGTDGVLASAQTVTASGELLVSMETFDQNSGAITKTFKREKTKVNSYSVDGIAAGDVALVTHYIQPKGSIFAIRKYDVMNPVTAGKFNGKWDSPIDDINVQQMAENQSPTTSLLFAIELKKQDNPILVMTDLSGKKKTSTVFQLDANLFGGADGPVLGQYTAANEAIFALSPDAGAVGGSPPLNVIIDLATGKSTQFNGYNNGYYHAGYVNGMAVDPNTGISATATELNAQVEFYNMNTMQGIAAVQLPCTGSTDQGSAGSGIAVDPINKLFLVSEMFYCDGSQGSAIVVYDESGNYVESITGFKFFIDEGPAAINPNTRTGWAFGPTFSQLQQFFY
jgi:hypothetical protein